MTLELRQNLRQTLEIRLGQVIQLANLMTYPDEVLSTVAGAITYSPEAVESVLSAIKDKERPKDKKDDGIERKVQTIYTAIIPSKGDSEKLATYGLIGYPDLRAIKDKIPDYQTTLTPDVTYIGRKKDKPEMVLSDHLRGSMRLGLLQLDPAKFPETSRLAAQLRHFDEWKRKKLIEAYVIIGDSKREFLEEFDYGTCGVFRQEDLAEKMELSESTVSRLVTNRWVEARDVKGEQRFMYVKDLFTTSDDLIRYTSIPELNKVLRLEFESGKSYSDGKIAEMVKKLARRTITKIRMESDIPTATERAKAYKSGSLQEPYKIT